MTFIDLADGGRALAPLIEPLIDAGTVVVSAGVGGLVTGAAVARALGVEVTPLTTSRSESGVTVDIPLVVDGLRVVVVDDGVETGTAARAVARALREAGAVHLVLAVPVCPREAEADLRTRFDDILAVERPLVRRSLRWHYETFA